MARSTLANLLSQLRVMVDAGTADYTAGTASMWDDDQLQAVLDRYRTDHFREALAAQQSYSGGTVVWKNYYSGIENLEMTDGGTAIFYVEDATGNAQGTANYSIDYARGAVTFNANTGGSTFFVYGRSYDLNRAAADVWRQKASHFATQFDFSTDNMKANKSSIHKQCLAMAEYYEQRAQVGAVVTMIRSDYPGTDPYQKYEDQGYP